MLSIALSLTAGASAAADTTISLMQLSDVHGHFNSWGALTIKNTFVCPAAFNIVEEMKRRIKG